MRNAYFKKWMIIGLILAFQVPFLSSADEKIPADVLKAAQEGIQVFLKNSKVVDLYRFGFSSQDEVNGATLGKGFQIYKVPPDSLLQAGGSQDLTSLAVATNLWEFLVLTGGKPKILLTVDIMDGKWTPVSIGSAGLAKEINKALETWPVSAGYQYQLVRVYQATSDFLGLSLKEKAIGILPFTSARISMGLKEKGFDPLDVYDSKDVASRIRSVVKENMGN